MSKLIRDQYVKEKNNVFVFTSTIFQFCFYENINRQIKDNNFPI